MRREASDAETWVYRFERADGRDIWVGWSKKTSAAASTDFQATGPVRVVDLVGQTRQAAPIDGHVLVTAAVTTGGFPLYVVADRGVVTHVRDVRKDTILADSTWSSPASRERPTGGPVTTSATATAPRPTLRTRSCR